LGQAIQERHENSLLKSELENLHKEIRAMREQSKRPLHCTNCGVAAGSGGDFDAAVSNKEQQLQLENARLRAEVSNPLCMPYVIGLDLLTAAIH
jgi:hypothetical protein